MDFKEKIYCIMITGKDDARLEYASKSIKNFEEQTYPNKILLIMNHNSQKILTDDIINNHPDIFEYNFDISEFNLGTVRNIALSFVPEGNLWTTWDDDDYRFPSYLFLLYENIKKNNAMASTLSCRIDYNIRKDFAYIASRKDGFVTVLCKKNKNIKYLQKTTFEDIDLLEQIEKYGKLVVLKNEPYLYIRLIHDNNTSLYVDKDKDAVKKYSGLYSETDIPNKIKPFLNNIIKNYYYKN